MLNEYKIDLTAIKLTEHLHTNAVSYVVTKIKIIVHNSTFMSMLCRKQTYC